MVLQHGAGDPKLSCSQYAGPQGEGKHRQDQRQNMFTSNSDRFAPPKLDEYRKLGPGSYPRAREKIVAWGKWNSNQHTFDVHRHGFRWESSRQRFDQKTRAEESARPNVKPLHGRHWENTVNVRIGKADRFPDPKSDEYKKKIGPGTYEVRSAHNRLLNYGQPNNRSGSAFKRPVGKPRTERKIRHGDPAGGGPGSYNAETPDETSARKHLQRADPTTMAHEIQTAPRIPRELRHGDARELGPGSYTAWQPRPRTADEPGRPSSAFAAPGRGHDSYAAAHTGAAEGVESGWTMAHDAKKWLVGGSAGAIAGSFSSCERFGTPHTVPEWRSEYTSRQQLLACIEKHEAMKARDRRDRQRRRKEKWRPMDD